MILGAQVKILAICFFAFACTSCYASEKVTDEASLKQRHFKLLDNSRHCVLEETTASITKTKPLKLSAPCHFVRKADNSLLHYAYNKSDILATIVIVGNPISSATRKEWNLDSKIICGGKAQGVLIYNDKIVLSAKTLEGGVMCPDKGLDEKDYWYLTH